MHEIAEEDGYGSGQRKKDDEVKLKLRE